MRIEAWNTNRRNILEIAFVVVYEIALKHTFNYNKNLLLPYKRYKLFNFTLLKTKFSMLINNC